MSDVAISAVQRLYWSVRRELWENRSIYLAPFAVGGIVLVGFFISLVTFTSRMRVASSRGPVEFRQTIEQPYVVAAIILMVVDLFVAVFYCLDALYGERRDRSILFWKSVPVSDLTAVLAKASIPILVLPVMTALATLATQTVMLFANSAVLAASGLSVSSLWTLVSLPEVSRINFEHLVVFHGIWYAPLYAWLLLVSAWATRLPFLWAALPPVAIAIVERVAFSSTRFIDLLQQHFLGGPPMAPSTGAPVMTMEMLTPHPLADFLLSPGLWVGLALSAVFLFSAIRLRRSHEAI